MYRTSHLPTFPKKKDWGAGERIRPRYSVSPEYGIASPAAIDERRGTLYPSSSKAAAQGPSVRTFPDLVASIGHGSRAESCGICRVLVEGPEHAAWLSAGLSPVDSHSR